MKVRTDVCTPGLAGDFYFWIIAKVVSMVSNLFFSFAGDADLI